MKVGDLVTVRLGRLWIKHGGGAASTKNPHVKYTRGIILDCIEGTDGFFNYEVFFDGMTEWFSDLELEALNENR
mgnify:CR=1 FL=1